MADAAEKPMTLEEFLAWAATQEEAYEFVDRKPRPLWPKDPVTGMAGGTVFHHVVQLNCAAIVKGRRPATCLAAVDARIELADGSSRIPDVALFCGRATQGEMHLPDPVLLVEVLSPTTADYDRGDKLDRYKEVATVREVWLVDSQRRWVTVWRRGDEAQHPWHADEHIGSSVFSSDVLGSEIPLAEIYADVEL
jgi:Uma2 family endonuclease